MEYKNNDSEPELIFEFTDIYIPYNEKGLSFLVVCKDHYKLYMYPEDHNPPHIHVVLKDANFSITLDASRVIAGHSNYNKIRKQARKSILNYLLENKEYLESKWDTLNPEKE